MVNPTQQSVLFQGLSSKPVVAKFDADHQSSDGGVVLLRGLDDRLGLTERVAAHLIDDRDPDRVTHTYLDLLRQRTYGIALGYADCNDAERIASDPCLKMACDRSATNAEDALGSQPTLSRFENSQTPRSIIAMSREIETQVIKRLAKRRRKAKRITIDLDPSVDPAHGQQAFTFFHGFYDTNCYLPLFGFLTIDDEPEQYLFCARLRPGNARCFRGSIPLLKRVVPELRRRFPQAKIRVRLDSGFANALLFDVLDNLKVEYLVGMPGNKALNRLAEPDMLLASACTELSGKTETFYSDAKYKARSWKKERRVVIKSEVVTHPDRKPKNNARFVITNLRTVPKSTYATYCHRGDAENRIKELKALAVDRTSCTTFLGNQLRVLMTSVAFVLYQELRWNLRNTKAAGAQVERLQVMLMKIGARVVESVRRVVLHFASAHPWQDLWRKVSIAAGASPA
ncbi:MAG: IS1380 family transposase [Solirubrobacterales bacterium]